MARKKNSPEETGMSIWIGPGVRGLISHGTVYPVPREKVRELLPEKVAALWNEGAGALVVSGEQLPLARLEVKRAGSALYKLSRTVAKKLTEK